MKCRHCGSSIQGHFLDLGFSPPSNAYLSEQDLHAPELHFPLRVSVCEHCWLVQTEDFAGADDLFRHDYAYFSSVSRSWLQHAAAYSTMICARFGLGENSLVIEVAANDGYLLKNFVSAGIPCLGIEPTASTAVAAEKLGIPVRREFFGSALALRLVEEGNRADLVIGNNVYAHVPDINDFTDGLKTILKPGGVITLEFPHVMRLIERAQFDTVYHEHFSYLSLHVVSQIFARAGLRVWDVEEIATHGGSLRVFGCHADDVRTNTSSVSDLLEEETRFGLCKRDSYDALQVQANRVKDELVAFLIEQKRDGKSVAAYGAAAKGNTVLNYGGIKPDLLSYVCDAAPSKQGKYLPGSHIPILSPTELRERQPDIVLILPWNLADEVMRQHECVREWGGKFIVAIPSLTILD
jgi:SAM-dependent methyltransferase